MAASGEQQRDSTIHTQVFILPQTPLPARSTHNIEFPVLHSRSLLVIHSKYDSVYMSIPNFLSIPSPVFCSVPSLVPDTDGYKCTPLGTQIRAIIHPVFSYSAHAVMMGTVHIFLKSLSNTYMENSLDFLKRYL